MIVNLCNLNCCMLSMEYFNHDAFKISIVSKSPAILIGFYFKYVTKVTSLARHVLYIYLVV